MKSVIFFLLSKTPMLKALQEDREELELSLSCDKSLLTWVTTVTKATDGISLLREIQSGLIEEISNIFQVTKVTIGSGQKG